MSKRLYYTDAYTLNFEAEIIERLEIDGKPAVVLNQSYFYPTTGGQPYDTGRLSQANVLDVTVRKEDGAVIHLLDRADVPDSVTGEIDWGRRFDHMQHHCGQHILSRAFIDAVDAPTVSFHMGPAACTIDLDVAELTAAQIESAEALANRIVQENRLVDVREVPLEEAKSLPIRKLPPLAAGSMVRLVDITGFDLTACGGTHVARTGEIGLIKVVGTERRKKMVRVSFLCGGRAIKDYDRKLHVLQDLTRLLSTGEENLAGSVEKMQQETKLMSRDLRILRRDKLEAEAQKFKDSFEPVGDVAVFTHVFKDGESVDDLRQIATTLCDKPNRIVLIGSSGDQAMLLFRSSAGDAYHMGNLLRGVLEHVGSRSGGGRADQAQGGGQPATFENVSAALHAAASNLAT